LATFASASVNAVACRHAADAEPAAPVSDPAPASTIALALDADRMLRDIEHLASDGFAGRHTLSDDFERVTTWLEGEYRSAGLAPVGETFAAPFPITTGAQLRGEQGVVVHRMARGSARPLPPDEFRPLAVSGSGRVRARVVFVGYAARADEVAATSGDDEASPQSAHPAYDDLAGLSLEGKIALVLLEAPGRTEFRAHI
jgi:hypothetical protein